MKAKIIVSYPEGSMVSRTDPFHWVNIIEVEGELFKIHHSHEGHADYSSWLPHHDPDYRPDKIERYKPIAVVDLNLPTVTMLKELGPK